MKKDSRLATNRCPSCDSKLDAAKFAGGDDSKTPQPEDLSCCIYCGAYMQWGDDMTLKVYPEESLFDLDDDLRLQLTRVRRAILIAIEKRKADDVSG